MQLRVVSVLLEYMHPAVREGSKVSAVLITLSESEHRIADRLYPHNTTKESFASKVLRCLENHRTRWTQFVCVQEPHEKHGYHYHLALKLNKPQSVSVLSDALRRVNIYANVESGAHYSTYAEYTLSPRKVKEIDPHPIISAGQDDLVREINVRASQTRYYVV